MTSANIQTPVSIARPFLKWAGGKSQLIEAIDSLLPASLKNGNIKKYFEPMIGGGAIFFYMAQRYNIKSLHIGDANEELFLAWSTLQQDVQGLIDILSEMEKRYHAMTDKEQEKYFYDTRSLYNHQKSSIDFLRFNKAWLRRTAQIIFMNKTCYNGLYRVNRKGLFNTPFGRYDNPCICDVDNLKAVACVLDRTEIKHGDFSIYDNKIGTDSFVYFDPPYRPLNKTSNFTAYSKDAFNDDEQLRLADFFKDLHNRGALLMLSNSDPRNHNPDDDFFDRAYPGFHHHLVPASRMINSKASKRSAINELVITNYSVQATT